MINKFITIVLLLSLFCFISCSKDPTSTSPVIENNISHIEISPSYIELKKGDSVQFSVIVYDADSNIIENAEIIWGSNNKLIASVDPNGLVKGHQVGFCQISASVGKVKSDLISTLVYETLYFTSFEPSEDSLAWFNRFPFAFSDDAPQGGSSRSLYVINDLWLGMSFRLQSLYETAYLEIRVWGKLLSGNESASIVLDNKLNYWDVIPPTKRIEVSITEGDWTYYTSSTSGTFDENDPLRMNLVTHESPMLIDNLEIRRIK